jgi:threonine/homoserine/homoserine lactone efflux protein
MRRMALLRRGVVHPAHHPRPDRAAGRVLCAGPGLAHGAADGVGVALEVPRNGSGRRPWAVAWLVTALNPKSITFFVAFLPAFLDPHADFLIQMLVFDTTFLVLAFGNAFGYALVASRARGFVANPRALKIVNRTGGGLLIGAGIATVTLGARKG